MSEAFLGVTELELVQNERCNKLLGQALGHRKGQIALAVVGGRVQRASEHAGLVGRGRAGEETCVRLGYGGS